MRKFARSLLILLTSAIALLSAKGQRQEMGLCQNPSGQLILLHSALSGQGVAPQTFTQQVAILAQDSSGYYHYLQCDSSGNIIVGGGSSFTAGNDLSGSNTAQTVIGINNTLLSGLGTGIFKFAAGVPALAQPNVDYALPTTPAPVPALTQLTSGCGVEYVSGLTFQVGTCKYMINGVVYNSPTVTLTIAPDTTNPEFVNIIVDNTGVASVQYGTPAVTPIIPTTDPTTQLVLTSGLLIPANATTPTNVVLATLFDECTEWTNTFSAHVSCAAADPFRGTHSMAFAAAVVGNFGKLTDPSAGTVQLQNYNNLVFYVDTGGVQWPTGASGATAARSLSIYWVNGTTQKGQQVVLKDGQFGFNSATSGYQQISIPVSLFQNQSIALTGLWFVISGPTGSSTLSFHIDSVTLQGGQSTGNTQNGTVLNYQGTYSTSKAYNVNDVVTTNGVAYVALVANTNVVPGTTLTTWVPLGGGTSETVTGVAAPVFSTATSLSAMVMTTNVTSFTLASGTAGQLKQLCFGQGAGAYTVTPPSNVKGFMTVGTVNGGWNCQQFTYNQVSAAWNAVGPGVINQ